MKILFNICPAIELAARAGAGHEANLAEDGALEPRAIKLPHDGPGNARVAVRVAAVEFVLVIEADGDPVGQGWRRRTPEFS